jgi:hypothetical protein
MPNQEDTEETYSTIFSSLKHPIRRKILRMLEDRELTFSDMLEVLGIDSGHLSYHLENLGDLTARSQNGKYRLSSFGVAAVRLMSGVEEYNAPSNSKPKSNESTYTKILPVVIAITLLVVSVYSAVLVTSSQSEMANHSGIPLALGHNETFSYPINFTHARIFESSASSFGITLATPDFANAINKWDEYYLVVDFEINQTYELNSTVQDSSGKVISSALWYGSPADYFSAGSGAIITEPGSYQVDIRNVNPDLFYAKMGIRVLGQHFQRPLFYYGLAGLTAASLYLTVTSVILRTRRHI